MGVSKVKYGDNTLVDLTQDTVTPETLQKGYTAHNAAGEPIVGTEEAVLLWQNTGNSSYKFAQNGDRWIANNRGVNYSTATSTWTVTVPEATTAYIGYRTATETEDKLSITLNGSTVLNATGGNMASETVLTIDLVEGENTLVATYTKDSSAHSYGDMAYVVLPPIGEQPGQYKYQSKSVTPSSSAQTVYPDTGYDGLYAVTVAAALYSAEISLGDNTVNSANNIFYGDGKHKYYLFFGNISETNLKKTTFYGDGEFSGEPFFNSISGVGIGIAVVYLPNTNSGFSVKNTQIVMPLDN